MILASISGGLLSNAITGGFLKFGNNAIGVTIPDRLFDKPGTLVIKGSGFNGGGISNPSNTIPDELSLVVQLPNISDSTAPIFSRIFTNNLQVFEFEIRASIGLNGSGSLFFNVIHDNGVCNCGLMTPTLSNNTFYNLAFKHTSISSLYNLEIFNLQAEYKSFNP